MTGLADCNNFFVSCERSVNPALEGKSVVVLSNNDGCVVARSNEAKKMGIRMGQPAFEIRDLIQRGMVTALSGNHILYREISLKMHDIFRRFVPSALDYSVDESFMDVSGIPVEALEDIGTAIYETCKREMHIPVTIGFAPTKTLAKIITDISKKRGEHVGIFVTADEATPYLERMPVAELWGIGRRLAKKLYQNGIYTLAQFAARNVEWVRQNMGVNGERSWRELHGEPCIELSHVDRLLQDSISESRTFPDDVEDYDYIRARIMIYISDCARKLRAMHGECGSVGVFLRTNPFHPEPSGIRPEGEVRLEERTNDTLILSRVALNILDAIFVSDVPFKRAGVWLGDIRREHSSSFSIFDVNPMDKLSKRKLMEVLDGINGSIAGRPNIILASQLTKGHQGHNDGYSSSFQAPSRKK